MKKIILFSLFLISQSILCMENQTPSASGFQGSLWWQSWTQTKRDLLLYAFEYNLFEIKNKDHKKLIEDALNECLKNHDLEKLTKILTIINGKFPERKLFKYRTARRIHDFITTRQKEDCLSAYLQINNLEENTSQKLLTRLNDLHIVIKCINKDFLKYHIEKLKLIENYCNQYKEHKKTLILLHETFNIDDDSEIIANCSDIDKSGEIIPLEKYTNEAILSKITNNTLNTQRILQRVEKLTAVQTSIDQLIALYSNEEKT